VTALLPFAATTDLAPYAVVMGAGFLIGIYGHLAKNRTIILTGILIVGLVSAYFVFVVGKLT
jgi:hypothetical protein